MSCNHLPTSCNHLPTSVQSSAYVRVIICLRPVIKLVPKLFQNSSRMAPQMAPKCSKIDPEASWRALGAVLAAWRSLGGLLERCWSALGGLRGRKKDLLSGSWALEEESQDRFQLSWGPEGSQNRAREGPKLSTRGDSS